MYYALYASNLLLVVYLYFNKPVGDWFAR